MPHNAFGNVFTIRLLLGSTLLSLALMLCARWTDKAIFWILIYPGGVLSLFVTGGHGGNHLQDLIGATLLLVVNALVYTVFLGVVLTTLRVLRKKP